MKYLIKTSNFIKKYKAKEVVIRDLLISKKVTLVVGENGSGKSTILKAIGGFINYEGNIEVNGITALKFKLKSTSGDVEATNLDLGETKFATISGDMEITNLKAKSFDMSLISGDSNIKKAVIEEDMYFNSVSGDVQLFEVECKKATLKTVSGDLNGNEFYPAEVTLKSVSGDMNITNRDALKDVNIISKKTVSGEINIK